MLIEWYKSGFDQTSLQSAIIHFITVFTVRQLSVALSLQGEEDQIFSAHISWISVSVIRTSTQSPGVIEPPAAM